MTLSSPHLSSPHRHSHKIMLKRQRFFLLLTLLLLLTACSNRREGSATADSRPSAINVEGGDAVVGDPAPRFTLTTSMGETLSSESLAGKVVILNFWATWCAPCRLEMPELEDAYQRHGDDDVVVIGVEVESSAGGEESANFLREAGVSFPIVSDAQGTLEKAFVKLPAYPTTVFINRQGTIHFVQVGPVTGEMLDEMVAQMDE